MIEEEGENEDNYQYNEVCCNEGIWNGNEGQNIAN